MKTTKCKFCDERFDDRDRYAAHLESKHPDMIPKGMTGDQFYYYLKTGKDSGHCIMCKKLTAWNPKTGKYARFCTNPKCKEAYVNEFRNRMIGVYGKTTLLNDPEQQRKMLAGRKISGVYTWRDGKTKTEYTGSYEREFLQFLDEIMEFDPNDVISPSPHTFYYYYNGEKHFYIPDFFIPSLNLEIEIKDGGDNPNTHPKIQAVDKEKERLKDEVMRKNEKFFNYLKISDKKHKRFLEYLMLAKKNFFDGNDKPIFMV